MKFNQIKQCVDMLYAEWDLGKTKSKAKGKICAWIFMFEILEDVEKLVIEEENGKVIGVCGYSKWASKKYKFRKNFFKTLRIFLMKSPVIKNKQALYKYNDDYDFTPKELEGHFDGEILILIVRKDYRGQKIGKKILNNTFKLAKEDGIKNIEILTDESCNFKFYEQVGCEKVYETIIPNSEPDKFGNVSSEKGFIYKKIML